MYEVGIHPKREVEIISSYDFKICIKLANMDSLTHFIGCWSIKGTQQKEPK